MTTTVTNPNTMPAEPIVSPFVVAIDSREQLPYAFRGLRADAKDGGGIIDVRIEVKGLKQGDYTILGCEDEISIERKSFGDLFATLGRGRERFIRELELLNELMFAAVVCECSWKDLMYHQPVNSQMSSKSVTRSIIAFSQRYRNVHWFPVAGRRIAEAMTFRILQRHWIDKEKKVEQTQ